MKKALSALFLLINTQFIYAQSPITISVGDIADKGQEFIISNANPLIAFNGTNTGANFVWDFSDLTSISTDTSVWVDVYDTDPFYFFLWLSSDVAEATGGNLANDYITVEEVFNFYKRNSTLFGLTGFAGTIEGIPFPIKYDEVETILTLPAQFGDISNSETGFNIDIPGVATWIEQRSRTNVIDGWGSLITPSGSFDVLRQRSEILITDTIIYAGVPIGISYSTIEYRWLANGGGVPVLQINAQAIIGTETVSQVIYKIANIEDAIAQSSNAENRLVVTQNPAENTLDFNINMNSNYNLIMHIYDAAGKQLKTENLHCNTGINNFSQDITNLAPGLYIISIENVGELVASSQFIKK